MELDKKTNKQLISLVIITHVIFILNCIVGYAAGKITLTPLYVSLILGSLNCIALFSLYRQNKASGLIRYIGLTGLYINHVFLMATTEVSVNNFTVFVILIVMSLMFFDKKLIASVLVITMLTHMVFSGLKASSITEVDTLSGLLIFIVFIGATYSLLKIFDEAIMLVKNSTEKRKDDLGHVGRIADYIYEQVTQLEAETNMLKKGSNEFQVSLQEVTKAIEDIAAGSLSVVADTEKIASYIAELEKTVSDNNNMNEIIDNKNQGLKLMSELSNLTKTTSKAIAEIDKMVNETS